MLMWGRREDSFMRSFRRWKEKWYFFFSGVLTWIEEGKDGQQLGQGWWKEEKLYSSAKLQPEGDGRSEARGIFSGAKEGKRQR